MRKTYNSAAEMEDAFFEEKKSHPGDGVYTTMRRVRNNRSVGSFEIDTEGTAAFTNAAIFTLYNGINGDK